MRYIDQIPGGLADDMQPEDFDPIELMWGVKVELEHTSNKQIAMEIAMDHLTEDPDYYKKLATIESHRRNPCICRNPTDEDLLHLEREYYLSYRHNTPGFIRWLQGDLGF